MVDMSKSVTEGSELYHPRNWKQRLSETFRRSDSIPSQREQSNQRWLRDSLVWLQRRHAFIRIGISQDRRTSQLRQGEESLRRG